MFKRNHMRRRKNKQSEEHAETDDKDDSDTETDADGRFSFTRTEFPMRKKNVPEFKKKNSDAIATETEYERAIANWIKHEVKWSKSHAKK